MDNPRHTPHTAVSAPTQLLTSGGTAYAYRDLGPTDGTPLVMLTHLAAVLDDWDPALLDALAAHRRVITFDNTGVGASSGTVPTTIDEMATGASAFITALVATLDLSPVDLFGMSMGGMVAQVIAEREPHLVRRLVLAGTGPAGGAGITRVAPLTLWDTTRAALLRKNPKQLLFFTTTPTGQKAGAEFVARLAQRTEGRDRAMSPVGFARQLVAITRWGLARPRDLSGLAMPALVLNGDDDRMVPTPNTHDLARRLPDSTTVIYPDAGHAALFQEHADVARRVNAFLS